MYKCNTRLNACSDNTPSESRNHIAKPDPSKSQSRIAVKEGPADQALPAGRIRSRESPESTGRSTAEVHGACRWPWRVCCRVQLHGITVRWILDTLHIYLRTYNIPKTFSAAPQYQSSKPMIYFLPRPHSSGFLAPFLKVRRTGSSSTFGNSPCTAPGDLAEAVLASLIWVKS